MQWDGKTYKQGWRGCLAFASACVDAQLLGGNAEVTVREKLIRAGNVGEVLREMLRGDFFDTMGYRIPIENASAGDVIQIEYVMAGSRRASFGIIEPRKEMLQIFDLTGLSCTSLRDWLQTPYVFRAWRPGK